MNSAFAHLLQSAKSFGTATRQGIEQQVMQQVKPRMLLACVAAVLAAQSHAVALAPASPVGEVSMLIGQAYLIQADGEATPLSVGASIRVTDTIETSSGGFVHIRFVDNALVTVRPYSSLEIVVYDYDAEAPQNSAVKLIQQEGVTRYISGQAAKNAKQNFRLNTPIAAIGVRGTDFVVSASETSMRALVNEGAIVVAPYSSLCAADAFGPCSQDAVELSSLSQQILEMNVNTAGATMALLPSNPAQAEQVLAEASSAVPSENKENSGKTDIYTDTVTARAVNQKLVTSSTGRPIDPPVAVKEYTPDVALSVAALTTERQLVWGRWSESSVDQARITVSREVAIENNRQMTVGDLMHGLYRVENGPAVLQKGLGVVKFELTQAQASYSSVAGSSEMMDVLGGNLQIDFQLGTFATDLQLSHAATGRIEFRDGGIVVDNGTFRPLRSDHSQWTAGAVSLDGTEAGYFFEKTLESGSIEGLTLWDSTSK
jgi:hypothetical protein